MGSDLKAVTNEVTHVVPVLHEEIVLPGYREDLGGLLQVSRCCSRNFGYMPIEMERAMTGKN